MVRTQSPNSQPTLRKSRRRLHRPQNPSPIKPVQMDQRKMAHLRRQTSHQTRRNHTLPTRQSLGQTQPSPKSRNKPQKDSRIQTGQAIHCEHKSSKNSRAQRKTPPITLKALYKKACIHNLTPPPLSRQKPLSPRADTIHNVVDPPSPHAPHQ